MEGVTVVIGVELAKDAGDNNGVLGSGGGKEEKVGAEGGVANAPVVTTVGALQDGGALAVGVTGSVTSGGSGESNAYCFLKSGRGRKRREGREEG